MSEETPSCIEDLANELWLEVFNYLDWINLYSAFYGLNKRINQLLVSIKALSLYSSYLINHSNSICIFFQEFPLAEFKQIQHLQLIYDSPYERALNIAKHLPSFPSLISLSVNATFPNFEFTNELAMIYFHQHCPFLQRLNLHGNIFDRELEIMDNASTTFDISSLLYIHVNKLHFNLAIQLLDQCPQLCSFSAVLYGYPSRDFTTASSIMLPTRISTGLRAMKKLNLGEDDCFTEDFGSTFLEFLLPRCPNLCTFVFDLVCCHRERRPLDPNWWTHVLASNQKLKRISLQLHVIGTLNSLSKESVQRFESLPLFFQLKVNVTYMIERIGFPRMIHNYSIKN